ncbi:peptidoglycan-binding protein [Cereibacter sphaeroides]|uniref:peptidoglycan-binding domain-containing protein n=1 Tax=Cereibacter sphaeroides TaxID=1063 RepID=UPI001F36DB8C|nr:peptidoglycan-binding domain-containing protein [Cereibacter sphaeroides]MCE6951906.1 peptidoglycan-binding protein [Cereibacter sphaeroides]
MYLKSLATASLAAVIGLAPAEQVQADAGDAIAGALVGGIIGHAIANNQNRQRQAAQPVQRQSTRSARPTMSSAERERNKEVQTALNYFGYPVGTVDGVLGSRSRSAISQYQVLLGYAPTGQLTEYERTILSTAYHRGVAGGPMVQQAVMSHPQGMRGLLLMQRDEMAGLPPAQSAGMTMPAPAAMAPAAAATAAAAAPAMLPDLPVPAAEPEPAAPELPSFLGAGGTMVSLASHCNTVGLQTSANGGYTTAAGMTDATFALGEQFCLARSFAISASEEMAKQVQGFTPQQIAEQCHALGPALQAQVAALSLEPRDDVLKDVSAFVLASGRQPAQLAGSARICLGTGYLEDRMDVAIGSALLLTALGQKGYAELLGHHLAQGFGASQRPDLALDWYQMGIDAAQAGGAPFGQGMPDRSEVIRKAAYTVGGRVDLIAPEAPAELPVFASPPDAAVVEAAAAPVAAPVEEAMAPPPVEPSQPAMALAAQPSAGMAEAGAKAVSAAARLPFLLLGQ